MFPISKPAIVRHASDIGGLDSEVVRTLQLLPERAYPDAADLRGMVQAIYLERGVPREQLPL